MQNLQPQMNETARAAGVPQCSTTVELQWWTTSDRVEHPVHVWTAQSQSAVVLYLHGIEGHGRWFEKTAIELNKRGITVYAADRRGAGASRETRGHAASWKRLVEDTDELLAEVRRRNSDVPCFLVANCWGSKVALTAAAREQNQFLSGIALTSPAVYVRVDVDFATKIRIGLSYIVGGKTYFDIPLTPEHFTDVPDYLEYIRHDQLRLTRATSSFFVESLKLTRQCNAASRAIQMPILVLQSGRDEIVNVEKIKQWFTSLNAKDKTLSMFTDAAHSLDFDYQSAKYQDALANWILEHARTPFLINSGNP